MAFAVKQILMLVVSHATIEVDFIFYEAPHSRRFILHPKKGFGGSLKCDW